jgi:hypothetical protein
MGKTIVGVLVSFTPPVAAPWAKAASDNAMTHIMTVKNRVAIGMVRSSILRGTDSPIMSSLGIRYENARPARMIQSSDLNQRTPSRALLCFPAARSRGGFATLDRLIRFTNPGHATKPLSRPRNLARTFAL